MDRLATAAAGSGDADASRQPPSGSTAFNPARPTAASAAREASTTIPSKSMVHSSATSSAASSPFASREPSPSRPLRASIAATRNFSSGPGSRSRKNSSQDLSPSRPAAKTAATSPIPPPLTLHQPGTIAVSSTPTLPPSIDPSIKTPLPQKSASTALLDSQRDAPRWPISPRLRSPPPVLNKPNPGLPRKGSDQDLPSINFQRPTPPVAFDSGVSDNEVDDSNLQPGMRTPARGSTSTLETVQEVSPLGSPTPEGIDAALEKLAGERLVSDLASQPDVAEISITKAMKARAIMAQNESGSEAGSIKAERRPAMTSAPSGLGLRQPSSSTLAKTGPSGANKTPKPSEGTVKTMTVETETVASIPQVSVAPAGMQGSNGSLRTKPSSETIRPRKEKRKPSRKQQMVQSGAASSKADNFEAKIASAVDEADTSDSDETFVYDSNPPDARDRPHNRFHSRTPSATSMASQVDRNGMRSIHGVMDVGYGHPLPPAPGSAVAAKKKKFSNTYNPGLAAENLGLLIDEDGGSARGSASGSGRGAMVARHPHHIGLWGRPGNGHTYLFDNDSSPFLGPQRPRISTAGGSARDSPAPPSPRFGGSVSSARGAGGGKRGPHLTPAVGYDLDDTTTEADNERTPLIHTMRSPRTRRGGSRYNHSLIADHQQRAAVAAYRQHQRRHQPSLLNRMASCLVLTVMLLLVVSGAIGFMFATSQPLTGMELVKITNVIASEQELMFDMSVKAQNPNVVLVVVDSSDLEIFAKSPYTGTDSWRPNTRSRGALPRGPLSFIARRAGRITASDDETGHHVSPAARTGPPDDPDDDPPPDDMGPLWRLGTVRELDQPLQFEGSFFNKGASTTTGGLRLEKPGNSTEPGGTQRWARVIEDEFDLVVKGVLKYSLPLSQRVRTIAISGKTRVKPNSASDPGAVAPGTPESLAIPAKT
ncbi:hypothetical protein GGTG_06756 [Gaeumannomyces tritici R3-111a-1]|uniref:Phospholipid metabolism enzyme regulator n=1 Tax=Gaeumannomyces tritici (strain R3-111a-1) TaxID=644352 RepID=J3NZQ9_GAET3|nr:hypothetical protein GGTG_06756 [Gaeumannomyces tritici R3-111a-1]EJT76842.1 hypothetical protein GGTG_06756 [Gaeumannomyces tritici R3-111a-1]